jgi:hypothetical protein
MSPDTDVIERMLSDEVFDPKNSLVRQIGGATIQLKQGNSLLKTYKRDSFIGEGSNGVVTKYSSETGDNIAVKHVTDSDDPELGIVKYLEENERCGVVRARYVQCARCRRQSGNYVVMEMMDGDLSQLQQPSDWKWERECDDRRTSPFVTQQPGQTS